VSNVLKLNNFGVVTEAHPITVLFSADPAFILSTTPSVSVPFTVTKQHKLAP
jgi:hypothetical protein